MPLLVLYNPVCGHGTAKTLFEEKVIPLLREHGKHPDKVDETTHAGHAGDVVLDFLKSVEGAVSIVLGSGDGTLHEILCALHEARIPDAHREVNLVLVPCGTANALYSSLFPPSGPESDTPSDPLKSLNSFLKGDSTTRPLTLAKTSLISPGAQTTSSSISAVVASTALHASILHDSEALRAAYPGIERFKMAAQQNITRWYKATVRLVPPCSLYQPSEDRFVPYEDGDLSGPFAYFLSTVNVDRLEPLFRITPLHNSIPPPALPHPPTVDIVVVRPLRDKTTTDDSQSSREQFSQKCIAILGGAYQDGAHVKMVYDADGQVQANTGPNEQSVAEYFRCAGWEWIPDGTDDAAHLVCTDGEILTVKPGGKAACSATNEMDGYSFFVYV